MFVSKLRWWSPAPCRPELCSRSTQENIQRASLRPARQQAQLWGLQTCSFAAVVIVGMPSLTISSNTQQTQLTVNSGLDSYDMQQWRCIKGKITLKFPTIQQAQLGVGLYSRIDLRNCFLGRERCQRLCTDAQRLEAQHLSHNAFHDMTIPSMAGNLMCQGVRAQKLL